MPIRCRHIARPAIGRRADAGQLEEQCPAAAESAAAGSREGSQWQGVGGKAPSGFALFDASGWPSNWAKAWRRPGGRDQWRWSLGGGGAGRWHDALHRLSDGLEQLALLCTLTANAGWRSPSGYYDTSLNGEGLIGWHLEPGAAGAGGFHPVGRFFCKQYYRSDVIQQIPGQR